MNLPDHITRQQITDAFALLGLDYAEVESISHTTDFDWVHVQMRGRDSHPSIEYVVVKIPIVEHAPEPDLVELARQEARG